MTMHNFNAQEALNEIREKKAIARRKVYNHSRLEKCRAELVAMRKVGASFSELVSWLQHKKHIKVTHTTVLRYLNKLPEMHNKITEEEIKIEEPVLVFE